MENIIFLVVGIIWCAGWIREIAKCHASMRRHDIDYPNDSVKIALPIVLFFTWPYFYFYGKSL